MKISARNQLKGEVISVESEKISAIVKVKIDSPATITSTITREAVEDLKIKKGDKVIVVVKASNVMIGKED